MTEGELINGYKILRNATMAGGGMCTWTFAQRNTKDYFIKEFLSPIYPSADSPGSPKLKEQRRAQCRAFEQYQKKLIAAVKKKCSIGGNLIIAQDFFRNGSKYYKVTEKVDVASISLSEISELDLKKRILIMTTVSHSLKVLHDLSIVHGDLKPDNILIKKIDSGIRLEKDGYTTKLIDFDNSFFNENPPDLIDEVVGDIAYYSPELLKYIKEKDSKLGKELTVKSDVFALGLIFSKYLTNSIPDFDKEKFKLPSAAVANGIVLKIRPDYFPDKLESLINSMLSFNYNDRPTISAVHSVLKNLLHSTEVINWKPKCKPKASKIKDSSTDCSKWKSKLSSTLKKEAHFKTKMHHDDGKVDTGKRATSRVRIGKNLKK